MNSIFYEKEEEYYNSWDRHTALVLLGIIFLTINGI